MPITVLVRPIRQRFGNVIIVLYHRYMYFCVRCYVCNYMNYLPNNMYVRLCAKNFWEKYFLFVYFCITARLNHFLYMAQLATCFGHINYSLHQMKFIGRYNCLSVCLSVHICQYRCPGFTEHFY